MTRSGFLAPPGFRESPHLALTPGEVVASTYQIQRELVRTETGAVFEARDMLMDRQVAFKLAWRDANTPPLLHEARRCAAVRDPCAVAVYGMGTHNGIGFVVGERVTGTMLAEVLADQTSDVYLTRLRRLVAAVARAHEHGVAIGDISGATVLVDPAGRMVLGRLSLSQVPAFGPLGQILAPEVVRGDVDAADPAAAEAIDLYGLGCVAIELARGTPPFASASAAVQEVAPKLRALRDDLPEELSDLVEWLLAKQPAARPRSASDVLAQIDAIIERLGMGSRSLRVLVVDDDAPRARALWSLARRAHPAAIVETAGEGTDAAHKLNRDQPDVIYVDVALRGVMNALELVMYARGLPALESSHLILVGELAERDAALFAGANVIVVPRDRIANTVLEQIRAAATESRRRRRWKKTVTGVSG